MSVCMCVCVCVCVIGRQLCDGRNGKKKKRCLQRMKAKLKALQRDC